MNRGLLTGNAPSTWHYYVPEFRSANVSTSEPTQPNLGTSTSQAETALGRYAVLENGKLVMVQIQLFFLNSSSKGTGDAYLVKLPIPAKRQFEPYSVPEVIGTGYTYHTVTANPYNQPFVATLADGYGTNLHPNGYVQFNTSGYALAFGTGSIAALTTTTTVTHGLGFTPLASDIEVMFTNTPGGTQGHWWISNITSTTFDLNIRDISNGVAPSLAQVRVDGTGTTTASATLGSAPTAGNIVVAVVAASVPSASVSMTTPGTGWTAVEQADGPSGSTGSIAIFARVVAGGESATYTATATAAATSAIQVYEITGAGSTVAAAIPAANHGSNAAIASATTAATPTLTPAANYGAYGIAGIFWQGGTTSAQSASNSFTIHVASTNRGASADRAIATTSGTYSTTFSWTTSRPSATALAVVQGVAPVSPATLTFGWKVRAEPNSASGLNCPQLVSPNVPWPAGLAQAYFLQLYYEPQL